MRLRIIPRHAGDFPEISVDVSTSGGSDSSVGGTSVDMSE